MYSNDWPLEDEVEGKHFMTEVLSSGLGTEEEHEMIAFRNAEKFLKLGAQRIKPMLWKNCRRVHIPNAMT